MSSQSPDRAWGGQTTDPVATVRVMQIICGALMMGVIWFAAIAIYIKVGQPAAGKVILAYLAAGAAAVCVVARLFVPSQIVRDGIILLLKARQPEDLSRRDLYPVCQTHMIVACALLEGAAFFNLVSYMVEGQVWTLAIVAALLALMASSFPTLEKVNSWADDQLRQLQLDPPKSI